MKGIFAAALGILALVAAGCGNVTGPSSDGTGKSYVKLSVNLSTLNPQPMAQAVIDQVTMIGARVIAPNDHAVLAQSATKQEIDANGVITIPVPATTGASLFAVGVDDKKHALMLGYIKGLNIAASTVLTLSSDDLTWVTPDAAFTGTIDWAGPSVSYTEIVDPSTISAGLTAPSQLDGQGCNASGSCNAKIHIKVSDPFTSSTLQPLICLGGNATTAPCYTNKVQTDATGWQPDYLYCQSSGACRAQAFVDGPSFSLPDRYFFGPAYNPSITWNP